MTQNQTISLNSQIREKDENLSDLRVNGLIPSILYGKGIENKILKVSKLEFEKIYKLAGESSLINLSINNDKPVSVLVKNVDLDPVKGNVIHIDFYEVNLKVKISAEIPLNFIGESKAVKELNGTLVKNINHIKVECLPTDLINHIDIDISVLENIHDVIKISDLKIPQVIEVHANGEDIVATVIPHKEIIEEAPVAPVAEGEAATSEGEAETSQEGEKKNEENVEKK